MSKKIIIDANFPEETRVALLKNNNLEQFDISSKFRKQLKGNIYLAKVTRVEPSLQAAFVDYGNEKAGFLPFSEIHPDYYHTLSKDKNNIIASKLDSAKITPEDLSKVKKNTIPDDNMSPNQVEDLLNQAPDIDITAAEDDVELISEPKKDNSPERTFKIQEVIKTGQILLIQVNKEERGNKGASVTTYISLAGKYCVLMPNTSSQNGISRKISNIDERKRLKKIINEISSQGDDLSYSVIARTAGLGHSTAELKKDYDYLAKLWNRIRETTLQCSAPSFIHQEDGILLKTIRDLFDNDVKEIWVQGKSAYAECLKFTNEISPGGAKKVKEYRGKTPIFSKYNIEEQLSNLYQPIVNLPSGGYVVINPTEALISIDVNSGKSTSENNVERMALKTNMEAAKEIARQAMLRDLSGLIVIDFIDMAESKHRKSLERYLWESFSKDKARIQTAPISMFGLLEMSRQRLKPTFLEMNSEICSHCSGKGLVRSMDANAMLILRTIENEIYNANCDVVNIYGISSSIINILNERRSEIVAIEEKYKIRLNFYADRDATSDSFSIEKIKHDKSKKESKEQEPKLDFSAEQYSEAKEEADINVKPPESNQEESEPQTPKKRKITRKPRKKNPNKEKAADSNKVDDKKIDKEPA